MCFQQMPPLMSPFEAGIFLDLRGYCLNRAVQ